METLNSSTLKKIVARKFDGEEIQGHINSAAFLGPEGFEVLDLSGRVQVIPIEEVKGIYFVRDFDSWPTRNERKVFLSRPKIGGLWVKLTFRDNDVIEGVIPNDLTSHQDPGLMVTPPDVSGNSQKIYIPKSALVKMEVRGVVTAGGANRARRKAAEISRQYRLFS